MNKAMTKRLLGLVLVFCMTFSLLALPQTASAVELPKLPSVEEIYNDPIKAASDWLRNLAANLISKRPAKSNTGYHNIMVDGQLLGHSATFVVEKDTWPLYRPSPAGKASAQRLSGKRQAGINRGTRQKRLYGIFRAKHRHSVPAGLQGRSHRSFILH